MFAAAASRLFCPPTLYSKLNTVPCLPTAQVSSRILQNKTLSQMPPEAIYHDFKDLGSRGPNTQSSASYLDEKTGVLFYTQVSCMVVDSVWN